MSAKKRISKSGSASSKRRGGSKSSPFTIGNNELRIKYENTHDLLDKLHSVTQTLSRLHTHQLLAHESKRVKGSPIHLSSADLPDVLGPVRAFSIVTGCAGEQDPNSKLGNIPGLDLLAFQSCVQQGVISAGYSPDGIPASASSTLDDVITAIEGSSR